MLNLVVHKETVRLQKVNAIWHGQNVAALVSCWTLAESDLTLAPSIMCMDLSRCDTSMGLM